MAEEIPKRDYQVWRLESFRKAVNNLWTAVNEVRERLEKLDSHGLNELGFDERAFWDALRETRLIGQEKRPLESGLTEALFRIDEFAHQLKLKIPRIKESP